MKTALLFLSMLCGIYSFSQSGMVNPGFETGDLTGWTGFIGDNTDSSSGPWQNIQNGIFTGAVDPDITDMTARHNIMSPASGFDPMSGYPIVQFWNGNYVLRLGNRSGNRQGQSIEQTWIISPFDTALVINYAVLIYDAGHLPNEGPYFEYEIVDSGGTVIFFRHDETVPLPSYYQNVGPSTWYSPPRYDTFDLSAYAGSPMTLRFATAACNCGMHCAYSYIDVDPANAASIGINEHNTNDIRVYPNPAANGVYYINSTVSTDEQTPVVYDMSGSIVNAICTRNASGWTIDISQNEKGVYFAQIPTVDGVKHCNLIRK